MHFLSILDRQYSSILNLTNSALQIGLIDPICDILDLLRRISSVVFRTMQSSNNPSNSEILKPELAQRIQPEDVAQNLTLDEFFTTYGNIDRFEINQDHLQVIDVTIANPPRTAVSLSTLTQFLEKQSNELGASWKANSDGGTPPFSTVFDDHNKTPLDSNTIKQLLLDIENSLSSYQLLGNRCTCFGTKYTIPQDIQLEAMKVLQYMLLTYSHQINQIQSEINRISKIPDVTRKRQQLQDLLPQRQALNAAIEKDLATTICAWRHCQDRFLSTFTSLYMNTVLPTLQFIIPRQGGFLSRIFSNLFPSLYLNQMTQPKGDLHKSFAFKVLANLTSMREILFDIATLDPEDGESTTTQGKMRFALAAQLGIGRALKNPHYQGMASSRVTQDSVLDHFFNSYTPASILNYFQNLFLPSFVGEAGAAHRLTHDNLVEWVAERISDPRHTPLNKATLELLFPKDEKDGHMPLRQNLIYTGEDCNIHDAVFIWILCSIGVLRPKA